MSNSLTYRPAKLALSDGTVYSGAAFGAEGEAYGEVAAPNLDAEDVASEIESYIAAVEALQ